MSLEVRQNFIFGRRVLHTGSRFSVSGCESWGYDQHEGPRQDEKPAIIQRPLDCRVLRQATHARRPRQFAEPGP
jgi:hypothetical protein